VPAGRAGSSQRRRVATPLEDRMPEDRVVTVAGPRDARDPGF
jgi:hypothetical protein